MWDKFTVLTETLVLQPLYTVATYNHPRNRKPVELPRRLRPEDFAPVRSKDPSFQFSMAFTN